MLGANPARVTRFPTPELDALAAALARPSGEAMLTAINYVPALSATMHRACSSGELVPRLSGLRLWLSPLQQRCSDGYRPFWLH